MSATIGGSAFSPIISARKHVVHASFRDEINAYATDFGLRDHKGARRTSKHAAESCRRHAPRWAAH